MKRKATALLACLLALVISLPARGELSYRLTGNGLLYIKADHRYANNAGHFGVSRMKEGVRRLNAALDGLNGKVPAFLYLAENSRSHQLASVFPEDSEAYAYLLENLHVSRADHLKYRTYEEFCRYFYATDHHWNHLGSYQGYLDTVELVLGKNTLCLPPAEEITLPVLFQGSFAKQEKNPVSREYFAFYRFDGVPDYTVYVNGKPAAYGALDAYLNGKYSTKKYENHYARLYGGDVAQTVLESSRQDGPVLLMLCNSYASPLKSLLTFHFRRVVCVDLRFYRQEFHQDFSLSKAVEEFEADYVLLLGDVKMFIDADHIVP